jgi:hypothetical protein
MIGIRGLRPRLGVPLGVGSALVLGMLFALRPADPAAADPPTAARLAADIAAQADRADASLRRLAAQLDEAIDAARSGAAATVSGDEQPDVQLSLAAERLDAAGAPLRDSRQALAQLAGLLAARPSSPAPALSLTVDDLDAVAGQLRATGSAADAFAAMRHGTADVLARLQETLVALDHGEASAARAAAEAGLRELDGIRSWEARLDTISLWIDTTDALLRSLRDVAGAQLAHDPDAGATARRAYATATATASRADLARAIAISEGGGDVTSAALAAAAALAERVDAAIATLAPLVHA